MNERQTDNEIWGINKTSQEKHFFFKNYAENEAVKLVPGRFLFF